MSKSVQKTDDDRCRIHLEMFEGPLDLLLYLIKRDEIEIMDIPICHVVDEYTAYLDKMEALDLSLAGEYLLMAALLLSIKARTLLPKPELDIDEIEDPRNELVEMLMDYQLYKKISERLSKFRQEHEDYFPKGSFPDTELPANYITEELAPIDLFSLFRTTWELLKKENLVLPTAEGERVDIEERMDYIQQFLSIRKKARFVELFTTPTTPLKFVATFVALLELVREKSVKIHQRESFTEIWLYRAEGGKIE